MTAEREREGSETHDAAVEELLSLARPARVVEKVRTFWWLFVPIGLVTAIFVTARIVSVDLWQHLDLRVSDILLVYALLVGSMSSTLAGRLLWWDRRLQRMRTKFAEPGFVRTRIADVQPGRVELVARIRGAADHHDPRVASVTHVAVDHQRDVYGPKGGPWLTRVQWQDPERFSVTQTSAACTLDDGSGEVIEVPGDAFEVLDLLDAPSGCAHVDDGDEVIVRGEIVRDVPGDPTETANYRDGRYAARFVVTGGGKPLIAPATLAYRADRIERTGYFRLTWRGFVTTTVALTLYAALLIYGRHAPASSPVAFIGGAIVVLVTAMASFSP